MLDELQMSDLDSSPDTIGQEPKSVVESVDAPKERRYVGTPGVYVTHSPDQIIISR